MQHGQGFFGLAHDEVLGDFQLQVACLQLVGLEQLLDALGQAMVAQLRPGEVYRQRAEGLVVLLPMVHLPAGLLQHPVAELQDGAILFGEVDEVLWRHLA
ncbi:hypothetical protein D3C79_979230 [compost metagenome]